EQRRVAGQMLQQPARGQCPRLHWCQGLGGGVMLGVPEQRRDANELSRPEHSSGGFVARLPCEEHASLAGPGQVNGVGAGTSRHDEHAATEAPGRGERNRGASEVYYLRMPVYYPHADAPMAPGSMPTVPAVPAMSLVYFRPAPPAGSWGLNPDQGP